MPSKKGGAAYKQKGNALEDAVKFIEKSILMVNDKIEGKDFNITARKRFPIDGFQFEVDVFVELNSPPGYESTYIFECKNWEKKVGQIEMINFCEKARKLKPQRGFFVAKEFTKPAINAAEKEGNITLLRVSDNPLDLSIFPNVHFMINQAVHRDVSFIFDKEISGSVSDIKVETMFNFKGESKTLFDILEPFTSQAISEEMKDKPTQDWQEGDYNLSTTGDFSFPKGEFLLGDSSVLKLSLKINFKTRISKRAVSKYLIEGRGAVSNWEEDIGGGKVRVSLCGIDKANFP